MVKHLYSIGFNFPTVLHHYIAMIPILQIAYRFATLFSHDSDSMPRVWTGKEDIRAITKTARSAVWHNLYYIIMLLHEFKNLT